MKTILVPTDFSKNAFVAGQYAASLAKETGAKVLFYHVYIVLYSGFEETGVSVKHVEWADQEASVAMEKLLTTVRAQYPDVQIEGEFIRGFMIDALMERLKQDADIQLIVMGTKGVTNVAESIFGSTTYEVLKKSHIPVLVIPEDTPDYSLQHVGFFSDYNTHEIGALQLMTSLLTPVKSFDVLHFIKQGATGNAEKRENWKAEASAALGNQSIEIKEIPVEKVDLHSVINLATDQRLDLMVFTRPQKPFFEKIFGKSLTKAVANYPVIPSLFIKE